MKARSLCLIVVLLTFSHVQAQIGVSTINGNVFDDSRSPVKEVWVELLSEFNSIVQRSMTDRSGRYTFTRLPYGIYTVRVNPLGTDLELEEKRIELSNVTGNRRQDMPINERVDFYLSKRRSSGPREVTGVLFAQEVPQQARTLYESVGVSDTSEAAVSKLVSAVAIFPKYHDALLRLGSIYIQNQKFAEAENAFATVVEVNPQGFSGWYGLGHSQFYLNNPASLGSIRKAVSINKKSANAWFILGLAERKSKNYEEALKALLLSKSLDGGKTADINWNLALLYYYNLKKPAEAADELELLLKINKKVDNSEQVKALIKKFRSQDPYQGSGK